MPSSDVIPVLAYRDVREAAAWLCRAFGFVERLRIFDHRIQLHAGSGHLVVTDGGGAAPGGYSTMVRVAGIDAHYARAKANGAKIISEPDDYPFGERQYSAEDVAGHRWTFSQSIADVDPAVWGGVLLE
ncbi:MAG: VOC family protein [Vicinamibacterales bacterium]